MRFLVEVDFSQLSTEDRERVRVDEDGRVRVVFNARDDEEALARVVRAVVVTKLQGIGPLKA